MSSEPAADAPVPRQCVHCHEQVLPPSYRDLKWIGGGAMGDVYRGRRRDMANRPVAIKIPRDKSPHFQQRFEREITASALLGHPNIVQAFDRGTIDGRAYLVMEFVDGSSLGEVVRRDGPLPAQKTARILRDVAAGLAHAAARGVVNRDLKPDNILLSVDGTSKILDYGLAKVPTSAEGDDCVTRSGVLLGTPAFMAPEQFHDPHSVTVQADVYSLGCTGFYALTGQPPFHADGIDIGRLHATAPRPSVGSLQGSVDASLDAILQQMMAIDPNGRPKPQELVQELDRWLHRTPHPASLTETTVIEPTSLDDFEEAIVGEVMVDEDEVAAPLDTDNSFGTVEFSRDVAQAPPMPGASEDDTVFVGSVIDDEDTEIASVSDDPLPEPLPAVDVIEGVSAEADHPPIVGEIDEPPPTLPQTAVINRPPASAGRWRMPEVVEGVDPHASAVETIPTSAIAPSSQWDAPPPLNGSPTESADLETLPASAMVSRGSATKAAGKTKPAESAVSRTRRTRFIAFSLLSLSLMVGVGALFYFFNPGPDAEADWAAAQEDYQLKKWKAATKAFEEFAANYPEHPHAADVPFFLDLCEAGPDIFSQTGNVQEAYKTTDALFQKHRDTPQYQAYCADIFQFLQRLVERSVEVAEKTRKPASLEPGLRSHELLTTVAASMPDEWVPKKVADLAASLEKTRQKLNELSTKDELIALLDPERTQKLNADELDATYEQVKKMLQQFPELKQDKELKATLDSQHAGEVARVTYQPLDTADVAQSPPVQPAIDSSDVFFTWGDAVAPREADQVFLALARGVLYAFDAGGNHLWSRRLGIDSERLPIAIPATENAPALFIAVSSLDSKLVALSQTTGHVLWQYSADGQELSAPLTITRWRPAPNRPEIVRGLLPTAGGEIHVLELSRGKRIGTFKTGVPMTVGGTFDPVSQLVFFPADSKRVLAIDPAVIENPKANRPAVRSVLLTNHASGSLRSAPVVVGQYMALIEAADLENTAIRVFEIKPPDGFPTATAAPLQEARLRGWTWFRPPTLPDRITVVTDEGELGAFGLNLDNPAEALYRMIEERRGAKSPIRSSSFRSLAVQSDEYLLWIMADGRLQHLSIDLLNQRWRTLWPAENDPGAVTGIPLHEASIDTVAQRIYVTTRALEADFCEFTAVDSETGEPVWRHQLGAIPAADPIAFGDRATMIDSRGRTLGIELTTDQSGIVPQRDSTLPPADAAGTLIFAGKVPGDVPPALVAPLKGDGTRLAVRQLALDSPATNWIEVTLPGVSLQGRPAVLGDWMVVPCSDGRIHRRPLSSVVSNQLNEQPYAWASQATLAPDDRPVITPLSETSVVLTYGREARWLELVETSGVTHWKQRGPEVLVEGRIQGEPLVTADFVFLADERSIYRVPRNEPNVDPVQWRLAGTITTPPFTLPGDDQAVYAVVGHRKVVCLSSTTPAGGTPLWEASMRSRICGKPTAVGKYLLVTEQRGRLTGVRLDNGEVAATVQLGPGIMPAAAAVPLGRGRVIVPLSDGTMLWTSLRPRPAGPVAQKGTL